MLKRKLEEIKKAVKVSYDVSTGLKLICVLLFWGRMQKTFGRVLPGGITLNLRLYSETASCVLKNNGHLNAFRDVFINKEYDLKFPADPKTIVDLGSNIGLSVIYFKLRYPEATVYAFEPHPQLYKVLDRNMEQFDDVILSQKLVSNAKGQIDFYVNSNKPLSSSIQESREYNETVKIESITLNDIINTINLNKIDILKFDIEGAEKEVFSSFDNFNKINSLVGELHYDLVSIPKKKLHSIFSRNFKVSIKQINKNRSIILGISI